MSYSIALFAFIGISLGGFYNYLAVVFTFVFIPVLEIIVRKSDEKYTDEEKKNRNLDPFFDLLLYLIFLLYLVYSSSHLKNLHLPLQYMILLE